VDKHRNDFKQSTNLREIQTLKAQPEAYIGKGDVVIAGEITAFRKVYTKNNQAMGIVTIEDWYESAGTIEVVFFPRNWEQIARKIDQDDVVFEEGEIVKIRGKLELQKDGGSVQIIGEDVSQNFSVQVGSAVQVAEPKDDTPAWMIEEDAPPPWADEDLIDPSVSTPQGAVAPVDDKDEDDERATQEYVMPDSLKKIFDPVAENSLQNRVDDDDNEDKPPREYWVDIYLPRTGDDDRDRRTLSRVHGLLTSYPGNDRFTIIIEGAEYPMVIEFPNHTTYACPDLWHELMGVLKDENNIKITLLTPEFDPQETQEATAVR
ncbi:MAG TPA: OB-fold nucleic acid binding domain-containing protein, partial [Aggregatilineales bacterium]|nr:OB-fold nucleic acid binding domain-containing protein [Aggregatilineales bacterium]